MSFRQIDATELTFVTGLDRTIRRFQEQPPRLYLLQGHSSVYAVSLALAGAAQQPFAIIDGAMKFNSYTLSRIASFLTLSPRAILRRAHLTRSFTAFQTEAAITTKLPRFIASTRCHSIIILGLLDTYYDEQITPRECHQSLQRIMDTLHKLVSMNIHVLIADVKADNPPKEKELLFQLVYNMADRIITIQPHHHHVQLSEDRSEILWDATTIPSPSSSMITSKRGANSGADCA